jgi:hypothetical protein
VLDKVGDRVKRIPAVIGLGEVIQTPKNHFHGNGLKGQVEGLGNRIGEVNQDGKQNPGSPDLNQDAVESTGPEVSQAQQAFDDVEGIFNVPTLGIEGQNDFGREAQRVGDIGQLAIPLALPQAFDEAQRVWAVLADSA